MPILMAGQSRMVSLWRFNIVVIFLRFLGYMICRCDKFVYYLPVLCVGSITEYSRAIENFFSSSFCEFLSPHRKPSGQLAVWRCTIPSSGTRWRTKISTVIHTTSRYSMYSSELTVSTSAWSRVVSSVKYFLSLQTKTRMWKQPQTRSVNFSRHTQ